MFEASAAYEVIWSVTQEMLEAARSGEWDDLVNLEKKRADQVAQLMGNQHKVDAHAKEVIQKILASDDEIKKLTESWLGNLQDTLASTKTEKKLLQAYRSPAQ